MSFRENADRALEWFGRWPLWYSYALGGVVFGLSFWLWLSTYYLGPAHVFWDMLANSLDTQSVVVETDQKQGNNTLKQLIQTDTSQSVSRSITTLNEDGAQVQTEIIGTSKADYTRYLKITAPKGKGSSGTVNTAGVLNVWARSVDQAQTATQTSGQQLYAQATLGVGLPVGSVPIPVGHMPASVRTAMLRQIQHEGLYDLGLNNVQKQYKNGHLVYIYSIKIQAILYVQMMQTFARELGLHELDQVDPNTYGNGHTLSAKIMVDAYSHQLVAVDTGQGVVQQYEGFGVPLHVSVPTSTIPVTELQQRLNNIKQ